MIRGNDFDRQGIVDSERKRYFIVELTAFAGFETVIRDLSRDREPFPGFPDSFGMTPKRRSAAVKQREFQSDETLRVPRRKIMGCPRVRDRSVD
jgi:hypothetical protein